MVSIDEFLLVKEAAEYLGVSANTLRTWASNGTLTEYRHPVNNYRLFRKRDLVTLLKRIENPKPAKRSRPKPK